MSNPKRSDLVEAEGCDWSLTESEVHMKALRDAAAKVARRYDVDSGDLEQDALMYLSVRPKLVKEYLEIGPGAMHNFLYRRLHKQCKEEADRMKRHESHEVWVEKCLAGGW